MNKKSFTICMSSLMVFALITSSCQKAPSKKKAAVTPQGQCVDDFSKKVSEIKNRKSEMEKATTAKDEAKLNSLKSAQDIQCKDVLESFSKIEGVSCVVKGSKEKITNEDVALLCRDTVNKLKEDEVRKRSETYGKTKLICHESVVELNKTKDKEANELNQAKKDKKDLTAALSALVSTCTSLISKLETNTTCRIEETKDVLAYSRIAKECSDHRTEYMNLTKKTVPEFEPAKEGQGADHRKVSEDKDAEKTDAEIKKEKEEKIAEALRELEKNAEEKLKDVQSVQFLSDSNLIIQNEGGKTQTMDEINGTANVIFYKKFFNEDGSKKSDDEVNKVLEELKKKHLTAVDQELANQQKAAAEALAKSKVFKLHEDGFEALRKELTSLENIKIIDKEASEKIQTSSKTYQLDDKSERKAIFKGELKLHKELARSGYDKSSSKVVACQFGKLFGTEADFYKEGELKILRSTIYKHEQSKSFSVRFDLARQSTSDYMSCYFSDVHEDKIALSDIKETLKGVITFK